MDDHLARVIGERIRFYRAAAYKTKTVVAGLAGITPDYLYQIERGQKLPTVAVLAQLSDVLRVELGDLLGRASKEAYQRASGYAADAIYRALTGPLPSAAAPPPLAAVRQGVIDAWETWQTSPYRYSTLTTTLPGLIADTEAAVRAASRLHLRAAHGCAADLYGLVRTVTKRIGRGDLSLLAADRAVRAAEAADDPIRQAGACWNLAQVLLADHQAEGTQDVAMRAADQLQPLIGQDNKDAMALRGSLLLVAAIAAARHGDGWAARDRLHQAAPLAKQTGERNTCWTAFGPTNVAMHAVSIEVETGEAVEGLRLAERVEHNRSPSIERRVAFLVDHAKGYQQRRDYASALLVLQTAEVEAPEDVRYRPAAHQVLRAVAERARRSVAMQAVRFARRLGLPV